jgi:hypothetical protein
MANLLVTLLSDQTVPNVQFIKEKQNLETDFLFVSTQKMERKGVRNWIQNVCNIADDKATLIIVDEFSLEDIEKKLNGLNYTQYQNIYVNVTGGTKLMSLGATDFFRTKNADIYYITGTECNHFFPKDRARKAPLVNNISLTDYLKSYGFELKESRLSRIDFSYTKVFMQKFLQFGDKERCVINKLREQRGKKSVLLSEIKDLPDFLCQIGFSVADPQGLSISKDYIKYLTGDWFEEYVFYKLKQELAISDENTKTGITLIKEGIPNEFDVIFLWKGTLYTIECKTSIINKSVETMNILNETIYKSTALQKNLGLFTKSFIFTLSSKNSNEVKENHIERAKVFGVQVLCREDIVNCQNIVALLNLPPC